MSNSLDFDFNKDFLNDVTNNKRTSPGSITSNRKVVKRKFPGPAGILPEQTETNQNSTELKPCDRIPPNETSNKIEIITCSQYKESVWNRMCSDWCNLLLNQYTIDWIKRNASDRTLIKQKSPFLAATIQNIDASSKDPMIVLNDPTGSIQATLIQEIWNEYNSQLKPGTVLVLKQIAVLSTVRKHYLTITFNNLVRIYCEDYERNVKVVQVQNVTSEEVFRSIEENYVGNIVGKSPDLNKSRDLSDNPYLKTLQAPKRLCGENEILTQVLDGVDTSSLFDDF